MSTTHNLPDQISEEEFNRQILRLWQSRNNLGVLIEKLGKATDKQTIYLQFGVNRSKLLDLAIKVTESQKEPPADATLNAQTSDEVSKQRNQDPPATNKALPAGGYSDADIMGQYNNLLSEGVGPEAAKRTLAHMLGTDEGSVFNALARARRRGYLDHRQLPRIIEKWGPIHDEAIELSKTMTDIRKLYAYLSKKYNISKKSISWNLVALARAREMADPNQYGGTHRMPLCEIRDKTLYEEYVAKAAKGYDNHDILVALAKKRTGMTTAYIGRRVRVYAQRNGLPSPADLTGGKKPRPGDAGNNVSDEPTKDGAYTGNDKSRLPLQEQ